MSKITIDKGKVIGKIKPMHAINNGPTKGTSTTLWDTFKEAGIPYARLHDTCGCWGGTHYVDIPNVFPNFDADVDDPNSYDFAFTDVYLKKIVEQGTEPFYRLGVTIENDHRIKAYNIYPPKDYEKWAKICEHVIMHYNEGWANGFNYGITYWEIWNEPDNELDPADNPMWKGSRLDYFRLYEVTANYLKERFPNIKIGGYASCGFYEILNTEPDLTAHISSRTENFIEFFDEFFSYITSKEHKSPIDFFSFHSYGSIKDNVEYVRYARRRLDEMGLNEVETNLNEWNPGIKNRGKARDASNIMGMFLALQNEPVDMLMYYDGQATSSYCGIYNPVNWTVFPAFYAFKYFNEVYKLKNQNQLTCDDPDIFAVSANNGVDGALVLANVSDKRKVVLLDGVNVKEIILTDEDVVNKEIKAESNAFEIGAYAIACVKF